MTARDYSKVKTNNCNKNNNEAFNIVVVEKSTGNCLAGDLSKNEENIVFSLPRASYFSLTFIHQVVTYLFPCYNLVNGLVKPRQLASMYNSRSQPPFVTPPKLRTR